MSPMVVPAPCPVVVPGPVVDDVGQEQELVLEHLAHEQVLDWRVWEMEDHGVVLDHTGSRCEA
ncbi:hypothetical protein ACFWIA_30450 [Streptomyces sp. NPDC127068]|uniref:hypothetical protein n=1 Tax=Streptomyces sp. NPDC127068 TaxID=3347127 RepID=UPI003650D702